MRRKQITRQPAILPLVLALLIVSAIGGWTLGAHWRPPAGALCQTSTATAPHPTKLMVIIGENESQTDVNTTTAPFEQTVLSKQCGSLRDMHDLGRLSQLGVVRPASQHDRQGLCPVTVKPRQRIKRVQSTRRNVWSNGLADVRRKHAHNVQRR
jgi:hypothetical protein